MAEAAVPAEPAKGPSLEDQMRGLTGVVENLARSVGQQSNTLEQLARGATAAAAAGRQPPPPDPATIDRANEEYLKTFATAPLAVRKQEEERLAAQLLQMVDQRLGATVEQVERRRRAEEMERDMYRQNPDLLSEGPYISFYLDHLARNPATASWQDHEKIAQATAWARENKSEREKQIIAEHERAQRATARASLPGGSSFRDPGQGDVQTSESAEDANSKRFEVLQGRKAAAMGGGSYIKR